MPGPGVTASHPRAVADLHHLGSKAGPPAIPGAPAAPEAQVAELIGVGGEVIALALDVLGAAVGARVNDACVADEDGAGDADPGVGANGVALVGIGEVELDPERAIGGPAGVLGAKQRQEASPVHRPAA